MLAQKRGSQEQLKRLVNNQCNMRKFFLFLLVIILITTFSQRFSLAEVLNSGNYQIEASIDIGGESSSSTNYTDRDSLGDINSEGLASTNYKAFPGFIQHAYPGIPGTPTLSNTGGTLYNALDFIINTGNGQQTDTTYAIAISSDDFATTNYIQTDDTIGSSAAWQTYTAWGSGSGERVTGLSPSTTYKIKVKARYGADTETGFSSVASAATTGPSLQVTFSGIASGTTIDGETTTVTSSANSIPYSALTLDTPAIAAHKTTVSTNASAGYTTTISQNQNLTRDGGSETISQVSGTNASPDTWPAGFTDGRFGYHTTDESLCTGTSGRFSPNNSWARLDTSYYEIACATGPATAEETTVTYKLQVGITQAAGNYQNKITYVTTAIY